MRPPQGRAASERQHGLHAEWHAEPSELVDHGPGTPVAILAPGHEKPFYVGRTDGEEISQDVKLTPRGGHGKLTSRDDADTQPGSRLNGLGKSLHRVMVGERNGLDLSGGGPFDYGGGRHLSIGGRGMQMKVDEARQGQLRYPASGEVHDGCDRANRSINCRSLSSCSENSRWRDPRGE